MALPEGEIICDVQDLPAPEPMQKIMEAVADLGEGQYVRMMHRMEPYPLYSVLEDMGFQHQLYLKGEAPYEIMIFGKGDRLAAGRIEASYGE